MIASNKVELLIKGIWKGFLGGFSLEGNRFIQNVPLPVTFPPIFDMFSMGEGHVLLILT